MPTAYEQEINSAQSGNGANEKYYFSDIYMVVDNANNTIRITNMTFNNPKNIRYDEYSHEGFVFDISGATIGSTGNSNGRHYDNPVTTGLDGDVIFYPGKQVSDVAHFTVHMFGKSGGQWAVLAVASISSIRSDVFYQGYVPCFAAGSRILTPDGYRLVESIATGDSVMTADGRSVPVKAFSRSIVATEKTAPYLVPANTFGPASPVNDLRLSPIHAFHIGKGLWQIPRTAAQLHSSIRQYGIGETVSYYHLECPNFLTDNLVCDGTIVESFGNRQLESFKGKIYIWNASKRAYTRRGIKQTLPNASRNGLSYLYGAGGR